MRLALVHLSDIHFKEFEGQNPILLRGKSIATAIASVAVGAQACFVSVTGDIAFAGKEIEYELAARFFRKLKDDIESRLPVGEVSFVFVPGNHDCDFSDQERVREVVLDNLDLEQLDNSIFDICCKPQEHFESFASSWTPRAPDSHNSTRLYRTQQYKLPDNRILEFRLINSAWMSTKSERQGSLQFPVKQLLSDVVADSSADLVVTAMHHPYNWFEAHTGRSMADVIEATTDITLTGHEHDGDSYRKKRMSCEQVEYVEGAQLQSSESPDLSEFHVIILDLDPDLDTPHERIVTYTWDRAVSRYVVSVDRSGLDFQRNRFRLRNEYALTEDFNRLLSDTGINLSHPAKDTVVLEDLFVYPDLREYAHSEENELEEVRLVEGPVPEFLLEHRKVLLVGAEKCGKTAMSKVAFRDLRQRGYVPIQVSGSEFKDNKESHVSNVIENAYRASYSNPDISAFDQLDKSRKVIIIDDFDRARLNVRGKTRVVGLLEDRFGMILAFGSEQLRFEQLFSDTEEESWLWQFAHCEILPFGHLRRADLVEKWCSLGQHFTASEVELGRRMVECERIVDLLLGKGFLPSHPFYILIILQQLELGNPIQMSGSDSSFGYLYEYVLTLSLARAAKGGIDLDTQHSYLSALAYHLLTEESHALPENELRTWHTEHCDEYRLQLEFEDMTRNLCDASILCRTNGQLGFRYPYMYYYFVSRYFRDHLVEDRIRARVKYMSERLYNTENANILMFLSYLSKDPLILSSILEASRKLFSEYPEYDLAMSTDFLDKIITGIPTLVLDLEDPNNRRRRLLAERDKFEAEENLPMENADQSEDKEIGEHDETDEVLHLNVAFKTIQLLGQTLRNFPGSMTGTQKYSIAKECYSLGLRLLSFTFSLFERDHEKLTESFVEFMKQKDPSTSDDDIIRFAKAFFWYFLEALAFMTVKHVSDSLGLEKLSRTYDDVLAGTPSISYRFIDLSLRLDHYRNFPEQEARRLYRDVRRSPFSAFLLRQLVWFHFYIYRRDFKLREKICARLGIQLLPTTTFGQRKKLPKG
jgi:hypothetical protein